MKKLLTGLAIATACFVSTSQALVIEMRSANDADWEDRDTAEMDVSWNSGFGNTAGSLQGTFAQQAQPMPETDAFRATDTSSGGNFTGNYFQDFISMDSYSFDFYADDVLPSDFLIRFSGAGKTFTRNVKPQVLAVDNWYNVEASLTGVSGWFGGTALEFDAALHDVDWVEIQITRNGRFEQNYYLDNFKINGVELPDSVGGWLILSGLLFVFFSRVKA